LALSSAAPPGLFVAAVAGGAIGAGVRAVPNRKSAAALVGQIPGAACWAWGAGTSPAVLARDLSALRVALGEDCRAVVGWFPEARVSEAPFAGELGAELVGADVGALVAAALAARPGTVHRLPGLAWDGEAEALLRMSGFASDWAGPVQRSGRPPDSRPGSDWLVGKGHDTFAPMGPWIVQKEFYGDPMKRLRQTLTVDGKVMQEAGAADMIHSIYELIEYGSSIITLYPGDVVNNGTSGGTGMGQAYRGAERFLKPGEKMTASIEGIGSITMNVVAEPSPSPGTGSRLPPVSTYRKQ